ncbi:MAG: hypothetical protein LBM23_06575 [Propionibacteriaceae bacterium]|jgi:hypothetical protein|nr:hypothetical protein [Propionibacteriaceae bacterium]
MAGGFGLFSVPLKEDKPLFIVMCVFSVGLAGWGVFLDAVADDPPTWLRDLMAVVSLFSNDEPSYYGLPYTIAGLLCLALFVFCLVLIEREQRKIARAQANPPDPPDPPLGGGPSPVRDTVDLPRSWPLTPSPVADRPVEPVGTPRSSDELGAIVFPKARHGYRTIEVDALVRRLVSTIAHFEGRGPTVGSPVTVNELTSTVIPMNVATEGYDMKSVDRWFDGAIETLAFYEGHPVWR